MWLLAAVRLSMTKCLSVFLLLQFHKSCNIPWPLETRKKTEKTTARKKSPSDFRDGWGKSQIWWPFGYSSLETCLRQCGTFHLAFSRLSCWKELPVWYPGLRADNHKVATFHGDLPQSEKCSLTCCKWPPLPPHLVIFMLHIDLTQKHSHCIKIRVKNTRDLILLLDLGILRQNPWSHEGHVWWGFPSLRDSEFLSLTWIFETVPGDFITLPLCNHTCSNLGAQFESRFFGPVATEELLCWLLWRRKLVEEAEMGGWGCIFLETRSWSKYLLVSWSYLMLLGYCGDLLCCSACTDSACLPSSDLLKSGGYGFHEMGLFYNC